MDSAQFQVAFKNRPHALSLVLNDANLALSHFVPER